MSNKILIFGGSGFIGSSLTKELIKKSHKISVVCSNKDKAFKKLGSHPNLKIISINIFNEKAVKDLVNEHDIVINLIGKLFEKKPGDFDKFHHQFVDMLSNITSHQKHLIHLSALAVEESSASSSYAKSKLDGQNAIIKNSSNYNIIKPSIVFGAEDNFFNLFAKIAKISPFLPLIGGGKTKFAPIYVKDLVQSIISIIENNEKYKNKIFEAGEKPESFEELMKFITKTTNKKRLLIKWPFFIAKLEAYFLNIFRIYLITPDQVELLKYDNILSQKYDNIDKIIGDLKSYKKIVPTYLS